MPPRKHFLLRLNPEVYVELRRWAEQEMRSLNAQIEFLLRAALTRRSGSSGANGPAEPDGGAAQPPEEAR